MNIFLKSMKICGMVLAAILVSLIIWLSILAKNPIIISSGTIERIIRYSYDPNLTVETDGAELKFVDYKLQLIVPNLKIIDNQQHFIQLENANFSLKLPSFAANVSAKVSKSELMSLVYFDDNPDLQKEIDLYLAKNCIYFDGDVDLEYRFFSLKQANVNLISRNGFHDPKVANLAKINLKQIAINLSYSLNKLTVSRFDVEYANNIKASLQGSFLFNYNGLELADFQANIVNLPVDYLAGLWPKFLAPNIQTWVTTNITNGIIKNAQAKFRITAEDLKAALPSKESIDAQIEVNGTKLTYLNDYSPISQIDAIVKIDGQTLYVNANKAFMLDNSINSLELVLPFSDFILSLKSNVTGKISGFKEFIPEAVYQKLLSNKIDFSKIKGNISGVLNLAVPIFDPFKLENLKLDIKASLSDVVLDQYKLLKFKQGTLTILNDQEKIEIAINSAKNFSFDIINYHNLERHSENQINISTILNLEEKISLKDKLILDKGTMGVNLSLNEQKWQLNLNLKDAEVNLLPLDIVKPVATELAISCVGSFSDERITGEDCNLKGKDFAGKILFNYSVLDGQVTNFSLTNGKIYANDFSIQVTYDKNIFNYILSANHLDLSKFDANSSSSDNNKINYRANFKVNNLILKNNVHLNNVSGKIAEIGNNPLDIDLKAFSNNHQLTIVKMKKNDQNGYLLHSDSAATFSQAFGIYKNIKRGELWIEIYPKKIDAEVIYDGNITIKKFAFSNTSVLTKIILGIMSPFNSPQAVMQALEGGSLKSESFTADLEYNKGVLTIKNGLVQGPSYDIIINGTVNNNNKSLALKGMYIPSAYGINSLISFIPVIGSWLSGGKKSAFIAANFTVKGSFDNPNVWLNPLSVFTPGFLRNFFN